MVYSETFEEGLLQGRKVVIGKVTFTFLHLLENLSSWFCYVNRKRLLHMYMYMLETF